MSKLEGEIEKKRKLPELEGRAVKLHNLAVRLDSLLSHFSGVVWRGGSRGGKLKFASFSVSLSRQIRGNQGRTAMLGSALLVAFLGVARAYIPALPVNDTTSLQRSSDVIQITWEPSGVFRCVQRTVSRCVAS